MSYLRLEGIVKTFNSFVAIDNISLEIEAGQIHAILGENGAGKTTLMNIISGLNRPDRGQIYLQDRPVKITSTRTAIDLGIGTIYQHFMLVPQLTVTENIMLGMGRKWGLNLHQQQSRIDRLARSYQLDIDPTARVGDLPVGAQQKVEILKVLYRQAKLLILDEPTAVLTPLEVKSLITILRELARSGHTIIFISHKLAEVMDLCDTVTVLRRGKVVAHRQISATTPDELAALTVGREISRLNKPSIAPGEVVLSVQNLQVSDDRGLMAVQKISFELREGEILGIAGVDGNGQGELADTIAGVRRIAGGTIEHLQQRSSIGYIPADRQKMGSILQFSIAQNLILKTFRRLPFARYFLLQTPAIERHARSVIAEFDIRATGVDVKVSQLSGGNQQKVVVARELMNQPSLIIAMQPTRGLDVGATASIQQRFLAERSRGAAIIYISTELEEVMAMSDRVAVMYRGEFVGVLAANTATVEEVGRLMGGGKVSQ